MLAHVYIRLTIMPWYQSTHVYAKFNRGRLSMSVHIYIILQGNKSRCLYLSMTDYWELVDLYARLLDILESLLLVLIYGIDAIPGLMKTEK